MTFVFLNGRFQADLSNVTDLKKHFSVEDNVFTLHLPKQFRTDQPIYLEHRYNDASSQSLRHHIVLDEQTDAVIVASYKSDDNLAYTSDISIKLDLAPNARLRFYQWQCEGAQSQRQAQLSVVQARDSYLGTYHVVKSAGTARDHFFYRLVGERATCESLGFYQTDQQQRVHIDSRIHHVGSHTNSRQLYKGIADDQSHTAFHGRIVVDPNIQDICAHQKNNNVLLSSQAQMDTQPELEIYADDVRCSHGATVGQLDEEALFYLRSRGVDETAARGLLMAGFANEVFDAFPDQKIAQMMRGVSSGSPGIAAQSRG